MAYRNVLGIVALFTLGVVACGDPHESVVAPENTEWTQEGLSVWLGEDPRPEEHARCGPGERATKAAFLLDEMLPESKLREHMSGLALGRRFVDFQVLNARTIDGLDEAFHGSLYGAGARALVCGSSDMPLPPPCVADHAFGGSSNGWVAPCPPPPPPCDPTYPQPECPPGAACAAPAIARLCPPPPPPTCTCVRPADGCPEGADCQMPPPCWCPPEPPTCGAEKVLISVRSELCVSPIEARRIAQAQCEQLRPGQPAPTLGEVLSVTSCGGANGQGVSGGTFVCHVASECPPPPPPCEEQRVFGPRRSARLASCVDRATGLKLLSEQCAREGAALDLVTVAPVACGTGGDRFSGAEYRCYTTENVCAY